MAKAFNIKFDSNKSLSLISGDVWKQVIHAMLAGEKIEYKCDKDIVDFIQKESDFSRLEKNLI